METVRIRLGALDANDSYPLELLSFPDNKRLAELTYLPKADVETAPWTPAAIRKEFRGNAQGSDNFRQIGNRLAEWIVRGEVGVEWTKRRAVPVRTMLQIEASELVDLPWELLGGEVSPLFRNAQKPIMRFHPGFGGDDGTAPWPIRLLLVAGTLNSEIGTAAEIEQIEEDLLPYSHSIDLEVLLEPDADQFAETVESFQPHVFHFTGHSSAPAGGKVSVLHFDKAGAPWNWSSADIVANLGQWNWRPRLVFLNACRTADGVINSADAHNIATAFNQSGVAATIANQGDIPGNLAANLAVELFRKLWDGVLLDSAMVSGREAIIRQTAGNRRDWAFPVLSLSVPPEQVLPQMNICSKERYSLIEDCKVFADARMIAGRRQERRMVRTRFAPVREAEEARYLVLITSVESDKGRLGKSHIMKWSGEGFAIGGSDVHYVRVADGAKKTVLDLLRLILDAKPDRSAEAISREVLYRFNWAVDRILTKGVLSPWDGRPFEKRTPFDPERFKSDNTIESIFHAFYAALREASATRRLVLVLDDFRFNDELALAEQLMESELWPRLFKPVARGEFPNVRMALVMHPAETKAYKMNSFIPAADWITLRPFPKKDYPKMAKELFWFCEEEGLSQLIAGVGTQVSDPWTPEALDKLKSVAHALYDADEHMARVKRMR